MKCMHSHTHVQALIPFMTQMKLYHASPMQTLMNVPWVCSSASATQTLNAETPLALLTASVKLATVEMDLVVMVCTF